MADREFFDVGTWKETKSGKNFFVKLGSATQGDTGEWVIYFDALPLPGPKGGCRVSIKPRRESGGSYGQGSGTGRQQSGTGFDSEEAPF